MYELVIQILEEERIPEEWKETIIVPTHTKEETEISVRITGKQHREMRLTNFFQI